jgi:phytochrome-interacting factor 4
MQMMWMGSAGIAAPPAVMFPGVHQYLPRMGVGMGAAAAAALPSMPRLPFMAPQPVVPSAPVSVGPVPAYRGHMPAVGITEPYGHYIGVNHLQPAPPPPQVQVRPRVPCWLLHFFFLFYFLCAVWLTSLGSTTRRA